MKDTAKFGVFFPPNWNKNKLARIKALRDLARLYLQRSLERWWEVSHRRVSSTVPMAALKPLRQVVGSAFTAAKCYRAIDAV